MHTYTIHKDRRCRKGFEIRWLHVRLLSPKIFIDKFPGGFNTHRANLELFFIYIKNKSWMELFSILWMVFMEKLCVWLFHCSFYWLFPAGGLKGEIYQERLGLLCACAGPYISWPLPFNLCCDSFSSLPTRCYHSCCCGWCFSISLKHPLKFPYRSAQIGEVPRTLGRNLCLNIFTPSNNYLFTSQGYFGA